MFKFLFPVVASWECCESSSILYLRIFSGGGGDDYDILQYSAPTLKKKSNGPFHKVIETIHQLSDFSKFLFVLGSKHLSRYCYYSDYNVH